MSQHAIVSEILELAEPRCWSPLASLGAELPWIHEAVRVAQKLLGEAGPREQLVHDLLGPAGH